MLRKILKAKAEFSLPFPGKAVSPIAEKTIFFLSLVLLFLGSMGFLGAQGPLTLAACVFFFFDLWLARKKFRIDALTILILLFCIAYIASSAYWGILSPSVVFHCLTIFVYQQLAFAFKDNKRRPFIIFVSLVSGLFAEGALAIAFSIASQSITINGGILTNPWGGTFARTGISLYLLPFSSLCIAAILYKNSFRKPYSIPLFIVAILTSCAACFLAGVVGFLFALFLTFSLALVLKSRDAKWKHLWILIVSIIGVAILTIVLIATKVIPLPASIANIPIIKRVLLGGSFAERMENYKDFFSSFYKYPLGGTFTVVKDTYVHNIVFDFYNFTGIIPFVLFIALLVVYFIKTKKKVFIKGIKISFFDAALLINTFGALSLGLIEPLYQANQISLSPFILSAFYLIYREKCDNDARVEIDSMKEMNEKDISILITSCDLFSDVWNNNINLLDKNWPNHPKAFLLSEKENEKSTHLNVSFLYLNQDYSSRLLFALSKIESEYVFLTLDDYLFSKPVNEKRIVDCLSAMKERKMSYLRFFNRKKTKGWIDKKEGIHSLPLSSKCYEVNLYPSIWKKGDLISIIKKGEDPWKCEVRMTRRCREHGYLCGWVDHKNVLPFVDTIRKGKYLRSAYHFLKKNKLEISDRKVRTLWETLSLNVRTFIADISPEPLAKLLRRLSGKKYFSDYAESDD